MTDLKHNRHRGFIEACFAAKEKELQEYPESLDWNIEGVEENSVNEIKKAYREKGLKANAEEDVIPVSTFGLSYVLK
ncbi:MAG: hypothetical protein Q8M40_00225 [Legionella sp.]|nr:hypothetical protein [Legionella sp.]